MDKMTTNHFNVNSKFKKAVTFWLLIMMIIVMAMIALGGVTRLTNSGLSIVYWKPISGIIPPLNEAQWQIEFEHYKKSPEYNKINYGMKLEDFKSIYWLEFWHRILGRITGLLFILPFIFFIYKSAITKNFIRYLGVVLFTIGLQGFFGWYMVKSGLINHPHVSHFRLAIHLVTAILIFVMLLFAILKVNNDKFISTDTHNKCLDTSIYIIGILSLIQIIYGAFVAGLDGGLVYNTFPLMDGELIPKQLGSIFSDITTTQFIHRYLAKVIYLYSIYVYITKVNKRSIFGKLFLTFLIILTIQALLGILTLIYEVPLILAVLHQINAIIMFSIIIVLLFILKNNNISSKLK